MCNGEKCVVCGEIPRVFRGDKRCTACWTYRWRHGVDRPIEWIERSRRRKGAPKWCRVCGSTDSRIVNQMCSACNKYFYRHGKDRPRHYWDEEAKCRTCKIPLDKAPFPSNGRCNACNMYKRNNGTERPKYLWGDGIHGWCTCGYPADHLIDKFPFCNRCAKEYQTPVVAVAGDAHGGRRGSVRW